MRSMLPVMLPVENALFLCIKGSRKIHVRCWMFLSNLSFYGMTLQSSDSKIGGVFFINYPKSKVEN